MRGTAYVCAALLIVLGLLLSFGATEAQTRLKLATTTSTADTGLLDALLPAFETLYGVKVDVIAVGTGKALKIAENGDVDVVLVHARSLEMAFVANGYGVDRRDVMYNDFVVVGPREDPAEIAGAKDAAEAFRRIAARPAPFVSRGDESGTHQKEKEVWAKSGMTPQGSWYLEVGQGMGATLQITDEKKGYCLTDRGTYVAVKEKLDLVILVEHDPMLFNPYGIIAVNPAKWPHVQYDTARKLIDWITSPEGQKLIAGYTRYGERLFTPSATGDKNAVD
jgi:tungstate transport system substrate-binding protein